MSVVYYALYQSTFQYGLLVWGGLGVCVPKKKKLQTNKNNNFGICLNESTLVYDQLIKNVKINTFL